ncbi:peptidoglycan-binding protein [Mesorhizobium sp. Root157]|uniref:peptidoglycan-binding domain-containing protein n=1 Tax=Mesorhizobium sp. Root157 TaxID=1736477 RepID=UPI0006FC3860|nr:peptidoglycan-binding domain-containing protein [Mesorhizobium sp. Root157]KQZ94183.1 peptidoglycan-binding protein [Mesorhizobium sp. Root157]
MARSAKRRKASVRRSSVFQKGTVALGEAVSRNPVMVGGSTAFLVTLFYVSANALWYQPFPHSSAFFSTRSIENFPIAEPLEPETTINIVRPETPKGDPVVEQVQNILKHLGFYTGGADGLAGPATRDAVAAYQRKVGLPVTGTIDNALLDQLGTAPVTASVPIPKPRSDTTSSIPAAALPASTSLDAHIVKVQAGLKAFGNEDIQLDGVAGARTKAAIREFQAIFRLPVTGEADEAVYAKMREIGLTD